MLSTDCIGVDPVCIFVDFHLDRSFLFEKFSEQKHPVQCSQSIENRNYRIISVTYNRRLDLRIHDNIRNLHGGFYYTSH